MIFVGKIINNSSNELSEKIEGLEVVVLDSCGDLVILGALEEETFKKLTLAIYEMYIGSIFDRGDNLEEFRKNWLSGEIEFDVLIPKDDFIVRSPMLMGK